MMEWPGGDRGGPSPIQEVGRFPVLPSFMSHTPTMGVGDEITFLLE